MNQATLRQQELDALARGMLSPSRKDKLIHQRTHRKESLTPYGHRLLANVVEPLAMELDEFSAGVRSGKAGRHHGAAPFLSKLPSAEAALVIARTIIDGISSYNTKTVSVAIRISQAIELEIAARALEANDKKKFARTVKELDENTANQKHRRGVVLGLSKRRGIELQRWSSDMQVKVGVAALEMFARATGMIEMVNRWASKRSTSYVQPTEAMAEWLNKNADDYRVLLMPASLPTVVQPKDWTTSLSGGYSIGRPLRLVKTRDKNYQARIEGRDMSKIFESLNILQHTKWRVNQRVLGVANELRKRARSVGKLRAAESLPTPPKPADIDTNEEARFRWRRAASNVYKENRKLDTKNLQSERLIQVAIEMAGDTFYFPYQLDFRGRTYSTPQFLNPQGNDLAKGLLEFAEGKPITRENGLYWLMVHVANTFGVDKCSLDERVAWTAENQDAITLAVADPLTDQWWLTADKPWQFLAACFEFDAYREEGDGYVSRVPIMLDGSCNGIQNFSAMLRDPIGGAAVNLIPAEKPQDIYQQVADVVTKKLEALAESGEEEDRKQAADWLAFGIDRKVAKRPVMTLPYGSTMYSCRQYIADAVHDRVADGKPCPWLENSDIFGASIWLSKILWGSIGEVVVAARQAMAWLQKAARAIGSNEIEWETPDGFLVRQAYPDYKQLRITTRMFGSITRKLSLLQETGQINGAAQVSGIAPNFVHSLDAAAMRRYVLEAHAEGIDAFAVVHDSFGTHAADTDRSVECIRRAFVGMYQENDVVANLYETLKRQVPEGKEVPPPPSLGTLDLNETLSSEYFFA